MSKRSTAGAGAVPAPRTRIKVISMGNSGVGKSCMIKRYCEGKFVQRYISTIGVDFGVKPVSIAGKDVRANLWDLAGHPDYFEVRNEFYREAQGAVLVFDVSNRASFECLDEWITEARDFGAKKLTIVVAGNKTDKKRQVSESEALTWAADRRLDYFETSAKSGQNVSEMFQHLFAKIVSSL